MYILTFQFYFIKNISILSQHYVKTQIEEKRINKVFRARSNLGISKQTAFAGINLYK